MGTIVIAVRQLRKNDPGTFQSIPSQIYKGLSMAQAIATANTMNRDSENVLQMNDYEKVMAIRNIQRSSNASFKDISDILGASDVSKY